MEVIPTACRFSSKSIANAGVFGICPMRRNQKRKRSVEASWSMFFGNAKLFLLIKAPIVPSCKQTDTRLKKLRLSKMDDFVSGTCLICKEPTRQAVRYVLVKSVGEGGFFLCEICLPPLRDLLVSHVASD